MLSNLLVRHVFVVFDVVRVGCEDAYEERDVHAEAEEGEEYAGDGLVLENRHLLLVVASVDFAVGVARRQDGVVAGAHHMATTAQTTRKSLRAEEGTVGGTSPRGQAPLTPNQFAARIQPGPGSRERDAHGWHV